jgi:hypothetical protein
MTPEDVLTFTPRRTLIDEVPVYSCDVPTLPPTIGIVFRVGAVDESLGGAPAAWDCPAADVMPA